MKILEQFPQEHRRIPSGNSGKNPTRNGVNQNQKWKNSTRTLPHQNAVTGKEDGKLELVVSENLDNETRTMTTKMDGKVDSA